MPTLSDEKYAQIIDDYLSGMTQKQAGIKNGIGRDAVGNILRRFDVPIREYTGERKSNQKWEWNRNFFSVQTPKTSYWGGFLLADGHINDDGNRLTLFLQEKDLSHLESFCDDIGIDKDAIYKDSNSNAWGVKVNGKNLGEHLRVWGVAPRKSKNFYPPTFTSVGLLSHFIRGWIDGDGSVYRYGRQSRIVVSSGNKASLVWFEGALRVLGYDGNIGVKQTSSKKYPDNYYLYIGGANQVSRVCDLLEVDRYFCMRRKWTSRRD